MVILDLETDGLLDTLTQIFCGVAYDTERKEYEIFVPDNMSTLDFDFPTRGLSELPGYLDTVKNLSCQNGIGFDLKVLKKILNYEYKGKYLDSVLLSRILWPDLENISYRDDAGKVKNTRHPHSVEAWGLRFGIAKPVIEDYTKFTPNTIHRCKEDVRIQSELCRHISDTIKQYAVHDSRTVNKFNTIIEMEQKVWKLLEQSSDHGWAFDLELGYKLVDELTNIKGNIEAKLIPILPKRTVQLTKTESGATKAFKADGSYTKAAEDYMKLFPSFVVTGDFCKVKFEDFNIGSSAQVKDYLLSWGWKPKEWNFKKDKHGKPLRDERGNLIKTSPKVPKTAEDWEEVATMCNNKDIALLAERNKSSHRLSQIRGLIDNVRLDHRIEAQANTCSTNTARMTHKTVVNIPKADPNIYYGHKMRSLFVASEGKVLVGCDASALEARCEAHYVYPYDKAAALELIDGDIHTLNAAIFQTTRSIAKNGKYAILYGCSPTKLASTIGKPLQMATEIYESYWDGNPALKQLKLDLEEEYKEYGYLLAIDGRPLTIRYKHAIINTKFQSCGAIIMKIALCFFVRELQNRKIEADLLGMFHDEFQTECYPQDAENVGLIGVESIRQAGRYLKLNVPLDGEYKVGKNWAETH
jgi:DNA polymerase-1